MAHLLHRLARWSFRHRWAVIISWIVILIGAGVGAVTLSAPTSNTFTLPGLESAQAFELIKERNPQAVPDGAEARIVFQAPEGETLTADENAAAVDATLQAAQSENVAQVVSPSDAGTISEDQRTGFAVVQYGVQSIGLEDADRKTLEDSTKAAEDAGLTVHIGGDALQEVPATGATELIGVAVALMVLIITFGSLVSAGLPLLTALGGVGIGVAGIMIATRFTELGSTTPILATMLGLAVGIDYALFIVSRYRHEISIGHGPLDATGRALGTAGSAVVVAGLTVIIALAGLSVVGIEFLTEMGIAAAGTVAVAVLLALTLLPALFGIAGKHLGASRFGFLRSRDPEQNRTRVPFGRRWADMIVRRPWRTFLIGIVAAAFVAIPTFSLQLAMPDDGNANQGTSQREAYDLIAENFGPGLNGPLLVVVDTKNAKDPEAAIGGVTEAVMGLKSDVQVVIPPVDPRIPGGEEAFAKELAETGLATITVIPKTGPSDAKTADLVHDLRDIAGPPAEKAGAQALVTGITAIGVDISDELAKAFPRYLAVIVGLALILLLIVFRSILVPIKATIGFIVTIGMTLGATVAVFQWGWGSQIFGVDDGAPLMSLLPIIITGIVFGLAMDYEFFLVSRIREEYVHGTEAREAISQGFHHGARVVTAAALIMISVFGFFAFADDPLVKAIGFALAVGIAADAFLVRMTLVPAFMAIIGDRMWWLPAWLGKILPNVDIEGEKLTSELDRVPNNGN